MRRLRYLVAMSLDGYIAGPNGEVDWITTAPEIDFAAIFSQFDSILVGRWTFDVMVAAGRPSVPGIKTFVFSKPLRPSDHPGVTVLADAQRETVSALKATSGKTFGCWEAGCSLAVWLRMDWWIRSK